MSIHVAERHRVGRRNNSDPTLIAERCQNLQLDPYAKYTPEERDAKRQECVRKSNEAQKQNRKFKEIFEKYLTDDKRVNIVKRFIDLLTNEKVATKDQIRLFELVLRILGEDGSLTQADRDALSSVITLKIE